MKCPICGTEMGFIKEKAYNDYEQQYWLCAPMGKQLKSQHLLKVWV